MSQLALLRSTPDSETRKLLLIGNPNVGKSLLFNRLTNRYVTVSNYPGTTVEITTAKAELDGELREVIDTPGTNSLAPQSNDERVDDGQARVGDGHGQRDVERFGGEVADGVRVFRQTRAHAVVAAQKRKG